jgi:hypothetical protein
MTTNLAIGPVSRPDAPTSGAVLVRIDSPLPAYSTGQMVEALTAYRELQAALDRAMPESIMELDGRLFRKKSYWRAIATAFNLKLEAIEERREVSGVFDDGRPNFGYIVTYRAIAPNGRHATGDGACFAVEKARRFRCPHPHPSWPGKTLHFPATSCPDFDATFQWRALPDQASEHNVRSHATTRATNRAISNLVAFGEVSAEEVERDRDRIDEPSSEVDRAPRTKARNAAGAPADTTPAVARPETIEVKVLGIVKRQVKNGTEKYVITADNQQTYQTFSLTNATMAKEAQAAGLPVLITYTDTKYGRMIQHLRERDDPRPEPPL